MATHTANWNYDNINGNLGKITKKKAKDWVFEVLAASCQHVLFCSFYTIHLIYLSTTAARRWAKPLLLQSATQDSLPKTAQNQVYFRYMKLQQCSNSAHVYKDSNRLVKSRCSVHWTVSGGHWCYAASGDVSRTPGSNNWATLTVHKRWQLLPLSGMKQVRGNHPTKQIIA